MITTVKLRKAIQGILLPISENSYHITAPAGTYPYNTFEINFSTGEDEVQNCSVEINVVDYGTSTAQVEALADAVQNAFSYLKYEDEDLSFYSYIASRQWVREDDKRYSESG